MIRKSLADIAKVLAIFLSVLSITAGLAYASGTGTKDRLRDRTRTQLHDRVCAAETKASCLQAGTLTQSRNRTRSRNQTRSTTRTTLRNEVRTQSQGCESRNEVRTRAQSRKRAREETTERARLKNR